MVNNEILQYLVADWTLGDYFYKTKIKCLSNDDNTDNIINDMINAQIPLATESLNKYLSRLSDSDGEIKKHLILLINKLFELGVIPDELSLELAIRANNIKLGRQILDYRVMPTKEHLITITNHRYYDTKERDRNKWIEMFILYGYQVKEEDILLLINKHIEINDIYRFEFDAQKILEECIKVRSYPQFYRQLLKKNKPSSRCLELACDKEYQNLKQIKELIKAGAEPNQQCLYNACKKTHKSVIKHLVEDCGLVIDRKCVEIQKELFTGTSLGYIVNKYLDL